MEIRTNRPAIRNPRVTQRPGPAVNLTTGGGSLDTAQLSSEATSPAGAHSVTAENLQAAFLPGPSKQERIGELKRKIAQLEWRVQFLEAEAQRPHLGNESGGLFETTEQRLAKAKKELGALRGQLGMLELNVTGGTSQSPRRRIRRRTVRRRRVPASNL